MNKLGVHAFVWEHGWSKEQATRAINRTAEAGYDFIEAPSLDPSSIDPAVTARLLEAAGIGIAFSMGLDFDADISSGDPDKEKRGKALLLDAVSVCRDCGGRSIAGILYSGFGKYHTQPTARGVARSGDILREVAEVAARSDIDLCLEVVNRYETNILNTAAQGVEMCRRIGAPNVKVHLDVYHMNIEESDIPSAIVDTGALARLLPHRRQPPRLPRLGLDRPRRASSAPSCGRTTRARSPSRASRPAWSASRSKASSASGATSGRTASTSPPTR